MPLRLFGRSISRGRDRIEQWVLHQRRTDGRGTFVDQDIFLDFRQIAYSSGGPIVDTETTIAAEFLCPDEYFGAGVLMGWVLAGSEAAYRTSTEVPASVTNQALHAIPPRRAQAPVSGLSIPSATI